MSRRIQFRDVRHIVHVIVIIAVLVVVFLIARSASVPKSFGQYGHYRGDSVRQAILLPVTFQTSEICRECHDRESHSGLWPGYRAWKDGKHSPNTCENCHLRCKEHVEFWRGLPDLVASWKAQPDAFEARRAQLRLRKDPITTPASPATCLRCHGTLVARPKVLKSYDAEKHAPYYKVLRLEEDNTPCTKCHYAAHAP